MYRTYLLCLCLLLTAGAGKAQLLIFDNWHSDADTGRLYLRMNPIGIIDMFDFNFTTGAEYRFGKGWSVTADAGYVFYSTYIGKVRTASGVMFRPGIRKYIGKQHEYFVDLQFHYKEVHYSIRDWIERSIVDDVATYEEYKRFRYQKQAYGGQITFGTREYLGRNRRLFMEAYAGIGVRVKTEGIPNEPNSRYDPPGPTRTFTGSDGSTGIKTRVLPALPGGIRLVYKLVW